MANGTLASAGQQVTPQQQAQAQSDAQAQAQAIAQAKAQIIAAVPGAMEKGCPEHQRLTSALPSKDRQKAYSRMRQKAAKNGGKYDLGNGQSVDVEQYIQQIEQANANGVPVQVKGAGTKGGVFLFQPTGEMQLNTQKKQEEEKKGFWQWCKDNWYWLALGAAVITTGVILLVRNNKKKSKNKVTENKKVADAKDSTTNAKNDPPSQQTQDNNKLNGTPGDGSTNVNLKEQLENNSIKVEQDGGVGGNQAEYSDIATGGDFWGTAANDGRM